MTRLEQYRAKHAETRAKMEAILAAAEAADGDFTDEQQKEYDGHKVALLGFKASIDREIEVREAEKAVPAVASVSADPTATPRVESRPRADADARRRGFRTHTDYLLAVIDSAGVRNRADLSDERLRSLAVMDGEDKKAAGELAFMLPEAFTPPGLLVAAGSDEQGEYDDRYGGFAVPPTFLPGMMQLGFEGDPTSGRTQIVPMTSPVVSILARTDKNHTSSVCGGLTVGRRAETVAATASRMEMERITLTAHSLFGLSYAQPAKQMEEYLEVGI